jgi:hypothetical protein
MLRPNDPEDAVTRVCIAEGAGRSPSGWIRCGIGENFDFSSESLASYFFAEWEPVMFDALLLAAAVEFCDRIKRRPSLGWAREFELRIPVHDPTAWSRKEVADALEDVLEFLTGDRWRIEFARRKNEVTPPQQGLFTLPRANSPAVMPFSDGLDSRAVGGLVAKELGDRLIRIRLGTKSHDRPKRAPFTAVPYRVRPGEGRRFVESSARSRGFKFALLSGLAAYLAGAERIILPESGQGAFGPALVPVGHAYEDYRNHPLFTLKMTAFLKALLGRDLPFEFPRLWFTKGETLREYVSQFGDAAADWADTRSCWQDNRQVSVDGHRRQCGICAACMLRRMSVHAAGLKEAPDTYVWESLAAKAFEDGAVAGFDKIPRQRDYAIAGALHLDHLAGLRRSPIHGHALELGAHRLAQSLGRPRTEIRVRMDCLLGQHEREWMAFTESLGTESFVSAWIEWAA